MAFVEYITNQGDRWDLIAFKAYGDPTMVNGIIEANAAVVISPLLEPGTRLNIPILEQGSVELNADLLPPWKR